VSQATVDQVGGRKTGGLRRRGAEVAKAASRLPVLRGRQTREELADLRERVQQLELDIQESRQMSKRLAEVTDVIAEVLLPAEQRDEERIHQLLARYESGL
jgi:hypothetical protein